MASNTVAETDAAGNVKPSKKKSREKIDGIVALIMALGRFAVADIVENLRLIADACARPVEMGDRLVILLLRGATLAGGEGRLGVIDSRRLARRPQPPGLGAASLLPHQVRQRPPAAPGDGRATGGHQVPWVGGGGRWTAAAEDRPANADGLRRRRISRTEASSMGDGPGEGGAGADAGP